MHPAASNERKQNFFGRIGTRLARILALPAVVIGVTGWIPNNVLDIAPTKPWPWGALLGVSLILTSLFGLVRPCWEALSTQQIRPQQSSDLLVPHHLAHRNRISPYADTTATVSVQSRVLPV
jgi:hypothetical protein